MANIMYENLLTCPGSPESFRVETAMISPSPKPNDILAIDKVETNSQYRRVNKYPGVKKLR